ncbi:helix-turn-helix domain-containing protein [Streptomyces odontomachi]|uniref:helix-turn-helix domain-containing protein n=1 Tax=Streptomyces odontomachi TaxID=2944940 RepID=UPI002108832D|nr:GAF domain-containing protein [Streptomyces sp. ODS25]
MPRPPSAAPHLRRLLDLLDAGAPAEALSAVVSEARAQQVGAAELRQVEEAAEAALRIRSSLHQHRRRELELAALFDTAGDLAASTDLDTVLRAIVRRARSLLRTDTAYLTLPDEEAGDTYMRVTDGSISPLFQRLRLSLGDGLGGLVAQTARPYATPDYRTDVRFRHTGTIDAGVLDEGLVAILGVPLLLGSRRGAAGKVIGVLFAADRAPRAFSQDEIALLLSLAAHAAIAIDNASTVAETRHALRELESANRTIRENAAALRRAEEAHDRLTDLVLRGGDLPDVATALATLLDAPITLHDPAGALLAGNDRDGRPFPDRPVTRAPADPESGYAAHDTSPSQRYAAERRYPAAEPSTAAKPPASAGPSAASGPPSRPAEGFPTEEPRTAHGLFAADELSAAAEESRAAARAVQRGTGWVCAVLAGQELLATLVLHAGRPLQDADRRLFERAAVVTGLLLLLRRRAAETENRLRGNFVADLLDTPDQDATGLMERGRRLGIDLRRPHLVLVAQAAQPARERLTAAAVSGFAAGRPGGVGTEYRGTLVLLLPAEPDPAGDDTAGAGSFAPVVDTGAVAREMAARLSTFAAAPVTVAAAGPASGAGEVVAAHAEASRCLHVMTALGRTGEGASTPELGFLGVVLGGGRDARDFVDATLGPLLRYDAQRGTELVRTLDAYFTAGQVLTRAKDTLHVHVNTVVQRLDRIQTLLGPDWNQPERALELHLALRLRALSDAP